MPMMAFLQVSSTEHLHKKRIYMFSSASLPCVFSSGIRWGSFVFIQEIDGSNFTPWSSTPAPILPPPPRRRSGPAHRLGFGAGRDGGGQRVGGQGREASLAAGEEGEQGGRVGEGASGERLTCGSSGVGTKAQVARSPPSRLRVCLFHIPLQRKQTPRLLWIK
jgi:hypothetical protein